MKLSAYVASTKYFFHKKRIVFLQIKQQLDFGGNVQSQQLQHDFMKARRSVSPR